MAAAVTVGSGIAAASAVSTNTSSVLYGPIILPQCFDVSYPSTINLWMTRAPGLVDDGKIVELSFTAGLWQTGLQGPPIVVLNQFPPPNGWLSNTPLIFPLDNGAGRTFDPHAFTAGMLVGFILTRNGALPTDTYARDINFPMVLDLQYTSRCVRLCC